MGGVESVVTGLLAKGKGFEPPTTDVFNFPAIVEFHLFGHHFVFGKPTLLLLIISAIVGTLFLYGFRRPQLVPRGVQNFAESIYDFVRNQIALDVIGPEGARFVAYLTTLFTFILVLNYCALVPGIQ